MDGEHEDRAAQLPSFGPGWPEGALETKTFRRDPDGELLATEVCCCWTGEQNLAGYMDPVERRAGVMHRKCGKVYAERIKP